jgi:hypothetical protein
MDTKLREDGIDCPDLNACSPAAVSQCRSLNMILAIRHDERHRGETVQNLCVGFWARETLEQLLEDQTRGEEHLACLKSADECLHFLGWRGRVAPVSERPNASIDEEAQSRLRSALWS